MRKNIGSILVGVSFIHQIVGIYFYFDILEEIGQAGIINSIVPYEWDRDAAFWFFISGVFILLTGLAAQWMLDRTGTLPVFMGLTLLILSIVGVVMMPGSGFWIVLPIAVVMIQIARTTPHVGHTATVAT
ncbi:MAG: DUF6463 family protein [Chloroflexota bacterium]